MPRQRLRVQPVGNIDRRSLPTQGNPIDVLVRENWYVIGGQDPKSRKNKPTKKENALVNTNSNRAGTARMDSRIVGRYTNRRIFNCWFMDVRFILYGPLPKSFSGNCRSHRCLINKVPWSENSPDAIGDHRVNTAMECDIRIRSLSIPR